MSLWTTAEVYGTNSDGDVYLYNAKENKFGLVASGLNIVEMSVGGSTAGIWGVTNTGAIYQF